jgi:hypothetical protein
MSIIEGQSLSGAYQKETTCDDHHGDADAEEAEEAEAAADARSAAAPQARRTPIADAKLRLETRHLRRARHGPVRRTPSSCR